MVDRTGFHVEVLPGKTEGLAAPHAGHRQETPEGDVAIVCNVGEEGGELLRRPDRQPVAVLGTLPGRIGGRCRVDVQASPPDGVVTGLSATSFALRDAVSNAGRRTGSTGHRQAMHLVGARRCRRSVGREAACRRFSPRTC